ncbi:MAG: transcription termination factor Rho [Candidatus Omnitrophica bacterium]|nr:transcription termination factor Rho [Candidatus Omnitrophota bacterium]
MNHYPRQRQDRTQRRRNTHRRHPSDSHPNTHSHRDHRRGSEGYHRAEAGHRARSSHPFLRRVSIDPSPRICLESGSAELTMRAMDLLCPIGCGQRGLIVAPPGSGKTTFLRHLCQAIVKAKPEIKLYCLLVDERPEEVTDFRRNVEADVRWSSSDQSYQHHIEVAEDLMAQAYDEADRGLDVMILMDSLTRLSRVHNSEVRGRGRTLSGGVDAEGLQIPRRIFGSARKIENGGSLGILATILIQTGSRMDEVIFEEFKGTGNMEIVLSREIANRRIYPAVNVHRTGTRKEELLISSSEMEGVRRLRQALAEMNEVDAAHYLVEALKKYPTNRELLETLEKS